MLKLSNDVTEGIRLVLPENWHEKILKYGKLECFPYEFIVEDIVKDKSTKEIYYLCKSEKKENGRSVKIALTEYTIKYLFAQEVSDLNIGLSFKEYLPMENTKVLITNVRNPSEVVPGLFTLIVESVQLKEKSLICLNFRIDFVNGSGFTSVKYYCDGAKKSTWKFLLNEDVSYMTDYEKMFRDTVMHKWFVVKSCEKLARYLEGEGATEHAEMLRERALVHDDSKMSCEDELNALSRIINDKSSLMDCTKQLSPIKQDAIRLHWKHNSHHPEHFKSVLDMTKLDIMEMCCD